MVAKNSSDNKSVPGARAEIEVKQDWAAVTDWSQALGLFTTVVDAAEAFGDGARLIEKDKLVGVEFLVLDFRFITDAKTEREYVSVLVINRQGSKARFNDGSTGVYRQCKQFFERTGETGGIICYGGLRFSDYVYENDKGEKSESRTYYFS